MAGVFFYQKVNLSPPVFLCMAQHLSPWYPVGMDDHMMHCALFYLMFILLLWDFPGRSEILTENITCLTGGAVRITDPVSFNSLNTFIFKNTDF